MITLNDEHADAPVIALHCSGAGANQWRTLGDMLAALDTPTSRYTLIAPEHYGCDSVGPWSGAHAFTLADEAARTVEIIDRQRGKVHLVGHSYGGGVALRAALERPHGVASITLYEPSAFHLLKRMGARGAAEFAEIQAIAARTAEGVVAGDLSGAASSLSITERAWRVVRVAAFRAGDAHTLGAESAARFSRADSRADADERLREPAHSTLVMRGEHAPAPTRLIAETLPDLLPAAKLIVVPEAGHMGPLTHAQAVNAAIARHIAECDAHGMPSRVVHRATGRFRPDAR